MTTSNLSLQEILKIKTGCPQVDDFIRDVRTETVRTNIWIKLGCKLIIEELTTEGTWIDQKRVDKAIELGERFFYRLFPWQKLVIACVHAFREYKGATITVWNRFDLVIGRGAGKNGFISFLIWYFTTKYHGINKYHVDLVANSEEQATRSFHDVREMLQQNQSVMEKQYTWNLVGITNIRTMSKIGYNTSNGKTKDSKRTGCIVFDEFHAYENYKNLTVYQSGLGKVPHPREFWISSFGEVRGAVFDDALETDQAILEGKRPSNGRLPLLWFIEDPELVQDPANWEISNPSLPYFPTLQGVIEQQWAEAQDQPELMREFMIKRMGCQMDDKEVVVTSWENIQAAARPLPDLRGRECVFGIDYAKTTDFVSAGLWFREGEQRYYIKKTWVCRDSADLPRIKAPLQEWRQAGYIEWVDDVEINPKIVTAWLREMMKHYRVLGGAIDSFRYTLMSEALEELGFEPKKDIRLNRGNEIMKIAPTITSLFANQQIAFGEDPEMAWSVNNAKQISTGRDRELGNYTFGKQEPKSRKTDSFMGMVHAATCEDMLSDGTTLGVDLGTITW